MNELNTYVTLVEETPVLLTLFWAFVLVLGAWVANFVVKKVLLRGIAQLIDLRAKGRGNSIIREGVVPRLANVVPAIVLMVGARHVPNLPETLLTIIENVSVAFIILTVARALSALLNVMNKIHNSKPEFANRPIKGYIQVGKITLFIVAAIMIVATLIDKSPVILLSGLGAMAAVLMLVFQDTLLSFVASVQISSADMVRVGDWIEMPHLNADGDVIDIALHTVKVRNWDKTITTVPTRKLVNESFKNWRGMHESGGRRIKRALYIDQASIQFLTEEQMAHLGRFRLLKEYLSNKAEELAEWNKNLGEPGTEIVNRRRVTNIGTFRKYVENYLRSHKMIHQDMTLLVRQLAPTPEGLPLEIYCFVNNTAWAIYEGVQSDIFDHLYAIMGEFGLQPFQSPSGHDVVQALEGFSQKQPGKPVTKKTKAKA